MVPFSDPVADGPIIMEAGNRAIKQGVTINYIFNELSNNKDEINCKCTNDVLQYHCFLWRRSFFKECEKVGVYGVIIPDLPYELTQN